MSRLRFVDPTRVLLASSATTLVCIGRREQLLSERTRAALPPALAPLLPRLVGHLQPDDAAASTTTWLNTEPPLRTVVCCLPEAGSRHDAPARPDQIEALVGRLAGESTPTVPAPVLCILLCCADRDAALASAAAVARVLPRYGRKTHESRPRVELGLACEQGDAPPPSTLEVYCEAVAEAARLHDTPASEMHTDALVEEAQRAAASVGASCTVLRGEELARAGLGGLCSVGRAAARPPALVVLSHDAGGEAARPGVCWVGKGIVHDTGGLNLKSLPEMAGMKGDMAGAASVLAAFVAAVRLGAPDRLSAVLCVADNAIGPNALRPDDVITVGSGKTVEITNTDCEGRLVLADGIAYAVSTLHPDVIVDLATLTDAAPMATGRRTAAIVSDDADLEQRAVQAGRAMGELVHPLPHLPELLRQEFHSEVADLTNAPRDGGNAGASCAATFVAEHLGNFQGSWLHVDLEGPSRSKLGRGTGFGVGLLLRLFGYL